MVNFVVIDLVDLFVVIVDLVDFVVVTDQNGCFGADPADDGRLCGTTVYYWQEQQSSSRLPATR
jgi:hypothetical protein